MIVDLHYSLDMKNVANSFIGVAFFRFCPLFGKILRVAIIYISAGPDPRVPPNLGSGSECTDLSVL